MRLNQLGYFEQLKPDDPNTTDKKLDEKDGTVDLALKVHEKGKNSIGLNGGVSGLEGAFVGLSYTTNNFLGLGETLQIQASIGNLMRSVLFGFTEPYLWDRPLQAGFTGVHHPHQLQPGAAVRDSQRTTIKSAFVLSAESAELHAVEHWFHRFS